MKKRWKYFPRIPFGQGLDKKPYEEWTGIDKYNDIWEEWYTLPLFDNYSGNEIRVMKHSTHEQLPWRWTITHTSTVHHTIIDLIHKIGRPYKRREIAFKTADEAKANALKFIKELQMVNITFLQVVSLTMLRTTI